LGGQTGRKGERGEEYGSKKMLGGVRTKDKRELSVVGFVGTLASPGITVGILFPFSFFFWVT